MLYIYYNKVDYDGMNGRILATHTDTRTYNTLTHNTLTHALRAGVTQKVANKKCVKNAASAMRGKGC